MSKHDGAPDVDDPRVFLRETSGRLSMSGIERVVLGTVASSAICFAAGMLTQWPISATRFRAENAHRMPRSEKGWYFYHRHKTNYAALNSMKAGFRSAAKYGPATGVLLYTEHIVDAMRGGQSKDFISTVIAAVTVAGCYSLLSMCAFWTDCWLTAATERHPVPTASHTLKVGLLFGLGYGLAQDALGLIRGRRLAYVEFVKKLASGLQQPDLDKSAHS
jgi:hypothetical protein